jgi:hypothetical protein
MTPPPSPTSDPTQDALPPSPTGPRPRPEVPNHTVLAAISILACFPPTGVVALMYSNRVDALLAAGDIEGARIASSKSLRWSIASIILGVIGTIALVVVGLIVLMPFIEAI